VAPAEVAVASVEDAVAAVEDAELVTKATALLVPGAVGAEWKGGGRKMANRVGWAPTFATPAPKGTVQSIAPPPSEYEVDKWHTLDNRESKREVKEVLDKEFSLLREKVVLEIPYKFLDFVNARQLTDKSVKLLVKEVMMLCRRVVSRKDYAGVVNVVLTDFPDPIFGNARRFSGIMRFPTVPNETVRTHLAAELDRNVPRSYMGKSCFSYQKLIRYLFAAGLGLTHAPYFELDMSNAQTQLIHAAGLEKGFDFEQTVAFMQWFTNRIGVVACLIEDLLELDCVADEKIVKELVLSAQGQQCLTTVAKNLGVIQTRNAAFTWLAQMARDVRTICNFLRDFYAHEWEACVEYADEHDKNAYAVFVRRLSNKGERVAIDKLVLPDSTRKPTLPGFHNYQHDGVGVVSKDVEYTGAQLEQLALERTGLRFKADAPPQSLEDILAFARIKYNLPFESRSRVCTIAFSILERFLFGN